MLASRGHVQVGRGLLMMVGISLVVAGACAVNNYLDRDIDARMDRTKRRPLVQGSISEPAALLFSCALALLGLCILLHFTTWMAAGLALAGLVTYTAVYTPSKRQTPYSTVIGSFPGAVPSVVGYTAVTGRLDLGALLLFAFLALWQVPHFYAIGIMRLDDYRAAGLPIWPLSHGLPSTKRQMLFFISAFMGVALAIPLLGYTGLAFLLLATVLCVRWLWLACRGLHAPDDTRWARSMFRRSLGVLVILCLWLTLFPH